MKRLLPIVLGSVFLMTSSVGFSLRFANPGPVGGISGGIMNCKGMSGKSCHQGMPGCSCMPKIQMPRVGKKKIVGAPCKTVTGKTCSSGTQGCVCVE